MDNVVHFEIPAANLPRARKFYKGVFGWKLSEFPQMNYTMIKTVSLNKMGKPTGDKNGINGGMMKRSKDVKAPVVYMSVKSIDASLKKIVKSGGSVVQDKTAIGVMGWSAYFKDSEGNVMGLFQVASM